MNRLALATAGLLAALAAAFASAAPAVSPGGTGWNATATHLRTLIGSRFTYTCPAAGTPGTVWGTVVYTDDSSVCTAAVHAGKITLARGGTVTIQIKAKLAAYKASTRNGISSRSWGGWHGSFVVVGGTSAITAQPTAGGSDWGASATAYRGQNGLRFVYTCPAGGTAAHVWGSGTYTDDSSVCTAAVHAGKLTLASGGTVTIEIRPGESSYAGTTQNGITTTAYGAWHGSFVFVG